MPANLNSNVGHIRMKLKSKAARSLGGDAGLILNWILRLLLILAIIGLIAWEGVAVMLVNFSAQDIAEKAATEANFEYFEKRSYQAAEMKARTEVVSRGAEFVSLEIDSSTRTISVTATKKASTLFIHNIEPLRKYTSKTAKGSTQFLR